jgi:hypothetical protein
MSLGLWRGGPCSRLKRIVEVLRRSRRDAFSLYIP